MWCNMLNPIHLMFILMIFEAYSSDSKSYLHKALRLRIFEGSMFSHPNSIQYNENTNN